MAVKTFTADGNKTVTVVGTKYNVTPTDIPAEVTIDYTDTNESVITDTAG